MCGCYASRSYGVAAGYTPGEYLIKEERNMNDEATTTATDPVCGMKIDTTSSRLSLEHEGTTYWFCGRGCLLEFRDDPAKYLDPGHIPSM
jgi:YHS domain-containing protein